MRKRGVHSTPRPRILMPMEEQKTNGAKLLKEIMALALGFWAVLLLISLISYSPLDPSFNQAVSPGLPVHNAAGLIGAYQSDLLVMLFGISSFIFPVALAALASGNFVRKLFPAWWRWLGFYLFFICLTTFGAAEFAREHVHLWGISGGGILGSILYVQTQYYLRPVGASLVWLFTLIVSIQLMFAVTWAGCCKRLRARCIDLSAKFTERIARSRRVRAGKKSSEEAAQGQSPVPADSEAAPSQSVEAGSDAPLKKKMMLSERLRLPAFLQRKKQASETPALEDDLPVSLQPVAEAQAEERASFVPEDAFPDLADAVEAPHHEQTAVDDEYTFSTDAVDVSGEDVPLDMPLEQLMQTEQGDAGDDDVFDSLERMEQSEQNALDQSFAQLEDEESSTPEAENQAYFAEQEHEEAPEITVGQETIESGFDSYSEPEIEEAHSAYADESEHHSDFVPASEPEPQHHEETERLEAPADDPYVMDVLASHPQDIPAGGAEQPDADAIAAQEHLEKVAAHVQTTPPAETQTQVAAEPQRIVPKVQDFSGPPSIDFLNLPPEGALGIPQEELLQKSADLEQCLLDFGIHGEVKSAVPGPVVTMFEYKPAPGVKVSRISNLTDDLALALKAGAVRIEAPLVGRDTVGIEIPNPNRQVVYIRDIIDSDVFADSKSMLTLALGEDIYGRPHVADLAKMPHLLVAGATGQGKSVCLNCLLMSFLYKASPDDLKLLLVDPKRIELSVYADLPHLVHPVVTDMSLAKNALEWAVYEMEKRYDAMAKLGVRNIEGFNRKLKKLGDELPEGCEEMERMPYLVIVIDELADLMLTARKEVETSIVRLAQLARAAGIHMILATQRPSVDVVTGLIKANFPSRIAFTVTSPQDSRTILDAVGANHLLGKGDMLFKPGGGKHIRVHGALVTDEEIEDVTDFWKAKGKPDYQLDFGEWGKSSDEGGAAGGSAEDRDDPVYTEAVQFVMEQGKASISLIQRRFRIGFNRAARYVEQMEQDGIVGPAEGSKPRRVLVGGDLPV